MKLFPLFLCAFLLSNVYGDESVDAQIERIMNAPQQERVELMNQLKTQLATMNEHERSEAIRKLQSKLNPDGAPTQLRQGTSMQQMQQTGVQMQRQTNTLTQPRTMKNGQ